MTKEEIDNKTMVIIIIIIMGKIDLEVAIDLEMTKEMDKTDIITDKIDL